MTFIDSKKFLKESPVERKISGYDRLNVESYNEEEAKRIEKTDEPIGTYKYANHPFRLFLKTFENILFYSILDNKKPYIWMLYDIQPTKINGKNGIISLSAWQSNIDRYVTKGFARHFAYSYLLKKYSFLQSDSLHTTEGKLYWKKMLEDSVSKLYCYVYDTNTKNLLLLKNANDFDKFYGPKSFNYRFVISKIKL